MLQSFSSRNFHEICNQLSACDEDLRSVIETYGYPPMWARPNTFETMVHIILEQQVSLASAKSALNKLQEKLTEVTPAGVLLLTDDELKACYFSRQKTVYVRHLAEAIVSERCNLAAMEKWPDEKIRTELIKLKGIGNWTVDIYLIFVLQRADIFPVGDLAAVNALKQIKQLPKGASPEEVLKITTAWQPHRTIATMILWHYYLSRRAKKDSK